MANRGPSEHAAAAERSAQTTIASDPEFSLLANAEALAELALGTRLGPESAFQSRRALAFLPANALDLDLDDPVQREFGDFVLSEKLGSGGMGVVYRARQKSLDRDVALKLLSAGPWASRDFIERFRREAQSAARLQHPNIVSIFEIGSHADLNFFTMRLVDGPTLGRYLGDRGGHLPPRAAAELVRTIAEAVDYAHRMGVLHLDLKPGNVLIDERGQPQVADFGLSRRLDETLGADATEVSGTPSYMAPEQAEIRRQRLAPATDVWGLGALLYQLLCGRPPFLEATPRATMHSVIAGSPVPPRRLAPDIHPDLEAICLKCLGKTQTERYVSARLLADDLGQFLRGLPVSVRPLSHAQRMLRWVRREPRVAVASALALVALLAGLVVSSLQWRRAEASAAASRELLWDSRRSSARRLAFDGKGFGAMALLADNILEQRSAGAPDADDVLRLDLFRGQAPVLIGVRQIPDAVPTSVALSADGGQIAVGTLDGRVLRFDGTSLEPLGTAQMAVHTVGDRETAPGLMQFIPGDRLLLNPNRVDVPGEQNPNGLDMSLIDLRRAAVVAPPAEFAGLQSITYSANARFAVLRDGDDHAQLWQVDPWRPASPVFEGKSAYKIGSSWLVSGDGAHIIRAGAAGLILRIIEPSGPNVAMHEREVQFPAGTRSGAPGFSAWQLNATGTMLALGSHRGEVFLVGLADGSQAALPMPPGERVKWLEFSPDGEWLGVVNRDGSAFVFDVHTRLSVASGSLQHSFNPERISVSHERRLALVSGEGNAVLWRLPEPGGYPKPALRLAANPASVVTSSAYTVDWSPKQGTLAAVGDDGALRLWRLPPSPILPARAPRQIASRTGFDGQHLVDVAGAQLRLVSAVDGAPMSDWIELPQEPGFAEITPDGETLVVSCGAALRVYDRATLAQRFPPIALEASPMRMALDPAGRTVIVAFGHNGKNGFEEQLEGYSLHSGEPVGVPVSVAGPLRQLEYVDDGRRVLLVGSNPVRIDLLAPNLAHEVRLLPTPDHEISAVSVSGDRVAIAEFDANASYASEAVRVVDTANRLLEQSTELQNGQLHALTAFGGGLLALGSSRDWLESGQGSWHELSRYADDRAVPAFAVGLHGRLLARAHRSSVQLFNATGEMVGAPLVAETTGDDVIAWLAFAPDGRRLVARTALGQWLSWPITGPLPGSIEEERPVLERLSAEETAVDADPGRWLEAVPSPSMPSSGRQIDEHPIPARDAFATPLMLDLVDKISIAPDTHQGEFLSIMSDISGLPIGTQRIDGVDYDLRGVAVISVNDWSVGDFTRGTYFQLYLSDVPVPQVRVAGFHILLRQYLRDPVYERRATLELRLNYVDGGSALVPLNTQEHLPGWTPADQPVPIGWMLRTAATFAWDGFETPLSNPYVANPHPERLVRSLDLLPEPGVWAATGILGITAEPVETTPAALAEKPGGVSFVPGPTEPPAR